MTTYDIVPTQLVVKAMRDNGYRNAAYAIAELMDNAIQAEASSIELLCAEKEEFLTQRKRKRIQEIAVLDNGYGMDAKVLRMALQFGNGTHLESDEQSGIGRFGMGLPNSSISQARQVDVWSWKKGVDNAIHTYIDIDEIAEGILEEVPEPQLKKIPSLWLHVGKSFNESGTLVVWSKIDRSMWKTGETIIKHSELLIGRIYRKFLERGEIKIRLVSFDQENKKIGLERFAKTNDPGYLFTNTSCPDPWANRPMFEMWGEPLEHIIKFRDKNYKIKIKFSYAKEEARAGHNPGAKPYGKHAAKNVGVSIIRADRELDLDSSWSDPSEPRDRWWGVEIEFPPGLDNLFGVTNNKQSARIFSDLANLDPESLLEDGQSLGTLKEKWDADEDPQLPLYEIANTIQKNIFTMRRLIKAQTAGQSRRKRYDKQSTEAKATEATELRKNEGYVGESDKQEDMPSKKREEEIKEELIQQGLPEKSAEELAATTIGRGYKYTFSPADISSPAFFDVKSKGGAILVTLNTNHPAYSHLVEILEEEIEGVDIETLQERLRMSRDGLELLLMAWARFEDEQPDGVRRERAQEARWDWGRMAKQFISDEV